MRNLYQILDVRPSATPEEIRQQYERILKQFEGKDKTAPMVAEALDDLNKAYSILADPAKRVVFDKMLISATAKKRAQHHSEPSHATETISEFSSTVIHALADYTTRHNWKKHLLPISAIVVIIGIIIITIQVISNKPSQSLSSHCKFELDQAKTNEERLLIATRCSDLKLVRSLIESGTNIHSRETKLPYTGRTPLHYAAETGQIEIMQYLLSRGAAITTQTETAETPLHAATARNQKEAAEILLRRGADPNAISAYGAPLHIAVVQGAVEVAEILMQYGADPNLRKPQTGGSPLHELAYVRDFSPHHIKLIELFHQKGGDINVRDNADRTPLDVAPIRALGSLINYGATCGAAEADPNYLIRRAAQSGSKEAVERLLSLGFDLNAKDKEGTTLMHDAALSGNVELLQFLHAKGLDIGARNNQQRTPLHEAVSAGKDQAVAFLISKGAQVNVTDDKGATPLYTVFSDNFYLFWDNNKNVVKALIDAGADIHIQNSESYTLLHRVADQPDLAQLLIEKGINIKTRSQDGKTPLHSLVNYGKDASAVKLLIKNGLSPNTQDNEGNTPLHLISRLGPTRARVLIAQILIAEGADTSIKNKERLTALDILKKNPSWVQRNPEYVKLLETRKW